MADFTYSIEHARRAVVRLRTPTNGAELGKALGYAINQVRERTSSTVYDDSITVETDETEIRLIMALEDWSTEKSE